MNHVREIFPSITLKFYHISHLLNLEETKNTEKPRFNHNLRPCEHIGFQKATFFAPHIPSTFHWVKLQSSEEPESTRTMMPIVITTIALGKCAFTRVTLPCRRYVALKVVLKLKTGTQAEGTLQVVTKMSSWHRIMTELRNADCNTGAHPQPTGPFDRTHRYLFSMHVYWGLDRISK